MNLTSDAASSQNVTEAFNNTGVNGCFLFNGEETKCLTLKYGKMFSSMLSIIGSLLTIVIIVLFKKYREFTQRMIANLSLGSLLVGVSYLLGEFEEQATPLCKAQGALMTFSVWAILCWIVCIIANLYRRAISGLDWNRKERFIVVFCWTVPAIVMTLPFIGDAYGPAGAWCWVKNDVAWRFGLWYIWDISFVFAFFVVMFHIVYKMLKKERESRSVNGVLDIQTLHADIRMLRMYPVVYFIVHLFSVIGRIQDAVHRYTFGVLLLQTLTGPLYGAAITFVFVFDGKTRSVLNKKDIKEAILHWRNSRAEVKEYQYGAEFQGREASVQTVS